MLFAIFSSEQLQLTLPLLLPKQYEKLTLEEQRNDTQFHLITMGIALQESLSTASLTLPPTWKCYFPGTLQLRASSRHITHSPPRRTSQQQRCSGMLKADALTSS